MSLKNGLPQHVKDLLDFASFAEFATLNRAGYPIDTPLLSFLDDEHSSILMATGLAYPVKAERARRNPRVGLFYAPTAPGEPYVQIVGFGAVRDSDIQANLMRYMAETIHVSPEVPWEVKREAIHYWARILIEIHPTQVLWWDGGDALDTEPHRWEAPDGFTIPQSDPAPAGRLTPSANWPQPGWQDAARSDIAADFTAYVTLVDAAGFPRPMLARDVRLEDDGLSFDLPAGAVGKRSGPCCLTYYGRDTFVGDAAERGNRVLLTVDRTLPILPLVSGSATFYPTPEEKKLLMSRLESELARRGQPMPAVPQNPPEQTDGARRRETRSTKGADDRLFEMP